ncbi:hypothetical protein A8709_32765 [Paenibacillus pectinilyticus]|uniref:DUF2961 domain-containing protein n=1 Tax=Paenibacillus pectinilyticus TaxID=512399 RepID=A0A1C0ZX27_9BACL|nr:glycoside hydrolase family 172 protein [Paenibacillus pectinilyticus]OCT12588.1 hypothetical protein A8709_32765 [Paenibacillus pectinilyticus]
MNTFNGLGVNMGNLWRLSNAKSRCISPENFTGAKGAGAMATEGTGAHCATELGQGWKISPSVVIRSGEEFTLAAIDGPGAVQSMWFGGVISRRSILRIYWDHSEHPSVECPLSDFFAYGWSNIREPFKGPFAPLNSLPVVVNPNKGMNCFWEMPFRQHCRITLENRDSQDMVSYYHINYILTDVPDDAAYFHAYFYRTNPVPYMQDHVILPKISGKGHYVGTALTIGLNGPGNWWGEGEVKFFIDGDEAFPTICGTGTEDYFGGSYDWEVDGRYMTYSTPYMGMYHVDQSDGLYAHQQRFAMYRWHVTDPIRFEQDLKVTIQDLGWRVTGSEYAVRQDDIATVAFWYQTLGEQTLPPIQSSRELEIF